ncbi:MAG: tetratricopeptide repeat protein [Gammaproteobacteria bacterium]
MVIALIVLALLLSAAAVWWLVRPLRAPPSASALQRETHAQLTQVRERLLAQLNELDIEAGDRNIDTNVLADERARIEAELAAVLKQLDAAGATATQAPGAGPKAAWVTAAIGLAVVLPLVAGGLYVAQHGATLARLDAPEPAMQAEQVPPMVLEMVARLEQRLKDQPNDAEGWSRLGRAYQVLGRFAESKQAYARAYQLAPNDVAILGAYAGMLVAEDPANPSPEAVKLFKRLHQLDPNYPGALWVLGLVAYKDQQYRQAASYWERLLHMLPPDSEVEPQIRRALDAARAEIKAKK